FLGELAGAEVDGGGARFEIQTALSAAFIIEGKNDGWLVGNHIGARNFEQSLEARHDAEGVDEEFVVIALIVEIEAIHEIERFAVQRAERERVGNLVEDGL